VRFWKNDWKARRIFGLGSVSARRIIGKALVTEVEDSLGRNSYEHRA